MPSPRQVAPFMMTLRNWLLATTRGTPADVTKSTCCVLIFAPPPKMRFSFALGISVIGPPSEMVRRVPSVVNVSFLFRPGPTWKPFGIERSPDTVSVVSAERMAPVTTLSTTPFFQMEGSV